jgi:hypothetical protein
MRIRTLLFIALALVLPLTSFGAAVTSCANWPTSPITGGSGVLFTQFTCSLYNNGSFDTVDLTPFETQGGALLSENAVGAAFVVVINGNPNTLSDNSSGLWNESLWQTLLYFVGDQGSGYTSDVLWAYWEPQYFPAAAVVQTYDQNRYGTGNDAQFFIANSFPAVTTFTPDANHEYDIYPTPEPGSIVLLGSSLVLLGGAVLRRRRTAGRAV